MLVGILPPMEADVSGHQRKVVVSSVRPARAAHGDAGIPLRNGRTLAFIVSRSWNAPAGYYPEQWFLVDPNTREVLYESPAGDDKRIWGLQSLTEITDVVDEPLPLRPGRYLVVFGLGGVKGGEIEVEALEAPATEAA